MYTKDRGPTKKWRIERIDELDDDELDEFYCTFKLYGRMLISEIDIEQCNM